MRTATLEERLGSPVVAHNGQSATFTGSDRFENATEFLLSTMTSPEAQGQPTGDFADLADLGAVPLETPNMTVIDNTTYCWDESLNVYTWCQNDRLYSVPLSEYSSLYSPIPY